MIIYKFGGVSVRNADAIRNFANIIGQCNDKLVVVVSAMDLTTNALEKLVVAYFNNASTKEIVAEIRSFHFDICNDLFEDKNNPVFQSLSTHFGKLETLLENEPSLNYDFEYDQIVCFGEILSTTIINFYLASLRFSCKWVDIRKYLKTDDIYRFAKIDWELSAKMLINKFQFIDTKIYITQGFIGSTINNLTTTLGREGSDYTASSLAYLLNAEKLVVWKDVLGIYNADPKLYSNAEKINEISYKDAVELAYYGATIIHPKTIKPLQNKHIPLYVNSFLQPEKTGTIIYHGVKQVSGEVHVNLPIFIFKQNQILISIQPLDFSFIAEQNLSSIFGLMAKFRLKANLMENSAVSFSVCVDNDPMRIQSFVESLQHEFKVRYNDNLELITIRNYTADIIKEIVNDREVIVQQKSRHTARYVVK